MMNHRLCQLAVSRSIFALLFLIGGYCPLICSAQTAENSDGSPPLRWWKGNMHTHSLWSDGDDFPEMIAAWYRDHDYNFLALSDHNTLSEGLRWMSVEAVEKRGGKTVMSKYQQRFGKAWVELRDGKDGKGPDVRLKPLDEFRGLVETGGQFLMIPAEEISDKSGSKPVHMNATNLLEMIKPLGGANVAEVMSNNLRQVLEQEKLKGRQILPHLNHPNFGYGVTAYELASVVAERFFEIHNGHPGVNQLGDDKHPSIDRMWDIANAIRLTRLDAEPLFGVSTDDSHTYHGKPGSHTGRGWVQVRSRYLTPEHLIRAMKAGDFYASSGVELADVVFNPERKELSLEIRPATNETFTTEFIVSYKQAPLPDKNAASADGKDSDETLVDLAKVGVVVSKVEGVRASYQMKGDELYVRARITSSASPADPSWEGQKKQAWTQPVGWEKK